MHHDKDSPTIARRRRRRARYGSPTFRQLVMRLCERIGPHHIPADADATEIDSLIGPDATHPAIIPGVLREVYRANGCGHLDARVRCEPTFEALGAAWRRLHDAERTDVEQIGLIETLGVETRGFFSAHETRVTRPPSDPAASDRERDPERRSVVGAGDPALR